MQRRRRSRVLAEAARQLAEAARLVGANPVGRVLGEGKDGEVTATTGTGLRTLLARPGVRVVTLRELPAPGAAVAVKRFSNAATGAAEAKTLARLRDTRAALVVPRFFLAAQTPGAFLVAMERVSCETRRAPSWDPGPDEIAKLERSVFALRRYGGVAHEDLNPGNYVLCPDRAVLLDFSDTFDPATFGPRVHTLRQLWDAVDAPGALRSRVHDIHALAMMWRRHSPAARARARVAAATRASFGSTKKRAGGPAGLP